MADEALRQIVEVYFEKVSHVDDDPVLPDSGRRPGCCLFLPNPLEQVGILRHDALMPNFAFAYDEIHGT
jgi:hypothetical protein